ADRDPRGLVPGTVPGTWRSRSRLLRPLELRVGDRIPVRVSRRVPERAVDLRLQLLREHVLEPVGLVMDVVHVQAEGARQVELQQPVATAHLDGDLLAGPREA